MLLMMSGQRPVPLAGDPGRLKFMRTSVTVTNALERGIDVERYILVAYDVWD